MLLDAKAPKFSMRGRVADIVPAAYEVKRRRLLAAQLKRQAQQAQRRTALAMVALLVVAFVLQACAPAMLNSLSPREPEPANPHAVRHHASDWYYID